MIPTLSICTVDVSKGTHLSPSHQLLFGELTSTRALSLETYMHLLDCPPDKGLTHERDKQNSTFPHIVQTLISTGTHTLTLETCTFETSMGGHVFHFPFASNNSAARGHRLGVRFVEMSTFFGKKESVRKHCFMCARTYSKKRWKILDAHVTQLSSGAISPPSVSAGPRFYPYR